ncbi:hypothetical protein TNCV_1329961 [Trichonephila clavipes]|uniref:Transposase n=1 Tax=Trichonephila clavipes TaxID=2585209 RepID=A0A8X6R306_TRICX|nr:hypothetical protein TNCV_1329961 [Trichonephila clavipes]
MGQLAPGPGPRPQWGVSSRSRFGLNKIKIRIISTVKCHLRLYSPRNWEFRMLCQLAIICDGLCLCIGLGLAPDTIITPLVKRRQSVKLTVLEAKQKEFVDDALIYAKSLCEELEISFEPPRRSRRKHIFGDGSKDVQLYIVQEWLEELWFQQDGATCHTARATIDLLKDTFGDRLISRFGPVNWPPKSCDLTPLDYFLWGYVKSLVYADKPQTLDHLEDNIRRVIADIRPQMLEKVIENWTSRLDYIRASRDSPMPEIIFKM